MRTSRVLPLCLALAAIACTPPDAERTGWGGKPQLVDITRDPSGRLWVLLSRPRADFSLSPRPRAADGPVRARVGGGPGVGDIGRRFEYYLEVLEPDREVLISTQSLGDRMAERFLDGEHLYGYYEDPDTGSVAVVLWRLGLTSGS